MGMEKHIQDLINIEEPYLKIEKKEKLTNTQKRVLGWKTKISTKYQVPFGKTHRHNALIIIIDLIENYNLSPMKIKEMIQEKELEKTTFYGNEYWRIYELLDNIERIKEKKRSSYMKS